MIARRLRLAFLNVQAAKEALPVIIDIMAVELKWSKAEQKKQYDDAMEFLETEMGENINRLSKNKGGFKLSKEDLENYRKRYLF